MSERWIAWDQAQPQKLGLVRLPPEIVVFDCDSRERIALPPAEQKNILGLEDDLLVVWHTALLNDQPVCEWCGIDLTARKRVTSYRNAGGGKLIALRDGIGYLLQPTDGRRPTSYKLAAVDFRRQGAALYVKDFTFTWEEPRSIAKRDALEFNTRPPTLVPWAVRP